MIQNVAYRADYAKEVLTKFDSILLANQYRMGDMIAVLDMCAYLNINFGKKRWFLKYADGVLPILQTHMRFNGIVFDRMEEYNIELEIAPHSMIQQLPVFNDQNLWIWNDILKKIGCRQEYGAVHQRNYSIVIAPLHRVDYSHGRAMSERFTVDMISAVADMYGRENIMVLLPDDVSIHDLIQLNKCRVNMAKVALTEAFNLVASASVFIGGDTGLTHFAGHVLGVQTIALHDRATTLQHNEQEFDHQKKSRDYIAALTGIEGEYYAFPNSSNGRNILFDHHGDDGHTIRSVLSAMASHFTT